MIEKYSALEGLEQASDMLSFFKDVATNIIELFNDAEAPLIWNWKIAYGPILCTVSIIDLCMVSLPTRSSTQSFYIDGSPH